VRSPTTISGRTRTARSGRTRSGTPCRTAPSTASAGSWTRSAARPRRSGDRSWATRRLAHRRTSRRTAGWCPPCRRPDGRSAGRTAEARHLAAALELAVRAGADTDTTAAWHRLLHGWPGLAARDLVRSAALTVSGGANDRPG
jgi:hypothetical protein